MPTRIVAIAEGVLVTLIWASSFVLVKMALVQLGPVTIAGLRYFLAAVLLLPFMLRHRGAVITLSPNLWWRLFLIGLGAYTIGNGALFWGLRYLPATTVSFLMSLVPLLILFGGILWLKEIPARLQVVGLVLVLAGNGLFFSAGLDSGTLVGVGIVMVGLLGFTAFGILGREVARRQQTNTLVLTTIPLALGGGVLIAIALPLEGLPVLSPAVGGIVLWLVIVNTAVAYILYNHALQVLTALEMNVLLNLSPLGTAGLAWLFLGELLTPVQLGGIAVAISGVTLVQWRRPAPRLPQSDPSLTELSEGAGSAPAPEEIAARELALERNEGTTAYGQG